MVGLGLGVGLLGAVTLALRYRMGRFSRGPLSDAISPAIFSTRVAQTTHGEMIYHISGTGKPVVFLHGVFLGASSYEWSKVYPHFAKDHEVIAPDLIGFGESERPDAAMDAGDYAESLAEFLREVFPGRPTAGISLLLAARHPKLVSRLVLFLPTGLKEAGKWRAMGMMALSGMPGINRFVYRNYLARAPFIRHWLSRVALANPAKLSEEMVDILGTCAQQYGAEHAILGFLRGRLAFDIEKRLPDVMVPVHILWPDRVAGFPVSSGESICRKLAQGNLEVLPDCGLLAALENPELVAPVLAQALSAPLKSPSAA